MEKRKKLLNKKIKAINTEIATATAKGGNIAHLELELKRLQDEKSEQSTKKKCLRMEKICFKEEKTCY